MSMRYCNDTHTCVAASRVAVTLQNAYTAMKVPVPGGVDAAIVHPSGTRPNSRSTVAHNGAGPHRESCCWAEHIKAICSTAGERLQGWYGTKPRPNRLGHLVCSWATGLFSCVQRKPSQSAIMTSEASSITNYTSLTCCKLLLIRKKNFKGCTTLHHTFKYVIHCIYIAFIYYMHVCKGAFAASLANLISQCSRICFHQHSVMARGRANSPWGVAIYYLSLEGNESRWMQQIRCTG